MRQRLVSVGIVIMVAGAAQTVRAQQQSSAHRGLREQTAAMSEQTVAMAALQPPPVATPAPLATPAATPRFTITGGEEVLASSSSVWRGFQPNSSFSVQPNTWIKIDNVTIDSKTYGGLSVAVR